MSINSWRRFHITEMIEKKGSIWIAVPPLSPSPRPLPPSGCTSRTGSLGLQGWGKFWTEMERGLCVFSFVFCVFVEIHSEIHSACEFSFRMTTRHAQRRTHLSQVNWNSGQVLLVLRPNPTPLSQFSVGPRGRGRGSDRGGRRMGDPMMTMMEDEWKRIVSHTEEKMCQSLLVVCQQCFLLVVFSPSVLIKCGVCLYRQPLTRTPWMYQENDPRQMTQSHIV